MYYNKKKCFTNFFIIFNLIFFLSFLGYHYFIFFIVCYYLVMKADGRSINRHPVVKHLVELRVYMEKMNPLEDKLKYQIDKLLRIATSSTTDNSTSNDNVDQNDEHELDAMVRHFNKNTEQKNIFSRISLITLL